MIRQETVDSEDNVIVQYIYTLGVAGERKSVTELNRSVEYTYDSLYRLTSETITEGKYIKYLLDVNSELTYDGTERCYYTRGDELISQDILYVQEKGAHCAPFLNYDDYRYMQ